jgi:GGDEF domain-containing protein
MIHPSERDLFRAVLDAGRRPAPRPHQRGVPDAGGGRALPLVLAEGRPIVGSDGEVMRCSGTIADITDIKLGEEAPAARRRSTTNLTGLPNRQIFLDRLGSALLRVRTDGSRRPP